MLTFDAKAHAYYWNGKRVPGVSGVLEPIGGYAGIPAAILERASARGTAVHLACELHDEGDLDESTLAAEYAPYLDAWKQFSADYSVAWERIEHRGYNEKLGYAGTLDRFGRVAGRSSVVDIKTTLELMPAVGPQLAAYAHIVDPKLGAGLQRLGVQLRPDGTYHVQQYIDPLDWPLFASLLTVRNWCAQHSVSPNFNATK